MLMDFLDVVTVDVFPEVRSIRVLELRPESLPREVLPCLGITSSVACRLAVFVKNLLVECGRVRVCPSLSAAGQWSYNAHSIFLIYGRIVSNSWQKSAIECAQVKRMVLVHSSGLESFLVNITIYITRCESSTYTHTIKSTSECKICESFHSRWLLRYLNRFWNCVGETVSYLNNAFREA